MSKNSKTLITPTTKFTENVRGLIVCLHIVCFPVICVGNQCGTHSTGCQFVTSHTANPQLASTALAK